MITTLRVIIRYFASTMLTGQDRPDGEERDGPALLRPDRPHSPQGEPPCEPAMISGIPSIAGQPDTIRELLVPGTHRYIAA